MLQIFINTSRIPDFRKVLQIKSTCNFFVNENNARFNDMKRLINFVKEKVKKKTGINLELEIILVE